MDCDPKKGETNMEDDLNRAPGVDDSGTRSDPPITGLVASSASLGFTLLAASRFSAHSPLPGFILVTIAVALALIGGLTLWRWLKGSRR